MDANTLQRGLPSTTIHKGMYVMSHGPYFTITKQEEGVVDDGNGHAAYLYAGYIVRWSYNGKHDATDYVGASYHKTLRGARIAFALRRRAAKKWS